MEFNTLLLFIIACVITIYFTWNYFSNRNQHSNSRQANDIRYYELKAKYEFLVAVVSLVIAIAIFFGLGTKKEIEANIKSEFATQFEPTRKRVSNTEVNISNIDKNLKNAQNIINTYYNALKQIDSKQKRIELLGQKSQGKFKEFQNRIDTLNKKNILKKNLYFVDDIDVISSYTKISNEGVTVAFKYDSLTTTLGDKLPKFKKKPLVLAISDRGYALRVFDLTTETFKVFIDPIGFDVPRNGIVTIRLIITEVE